MIFLFAAQDAARNVDVFSPGVGGFLWQEYNAGSYSRIILCILTIGVIGLVLDRLMSLAESRFKTA